MDKYSFLNAAHTDYFTELYDKYLKYPDTVEPSWRAFFQGLNQFKGPKYSSEFIIFTFLYILFTSGQHTLY